MPTHDGYVRNIGDSSPQWTNTHVHEIDDRSVNDPIQEVGNAANILVIIAREAVLRGERTTIRTMAIGTSP